MQFHAMDKGKATILLLLFMLLTSSYPAAVNAAPAGSQQQGILSVNIVTDAINVSSAYIMHYCKDNDNHSVLL